MAMPRKCHNLSVNEAVGTVDSCSLATIYQCFNDLGNWDSVTSGPVDVLELGSLWLQRLD